MRARTSSFTGRAMPLAEKGQCAMGGSPMMAYAAFCVVICPERGQSHHWEEV